MKAAQERTRKRWATMEELMSAGERKQRIIHSIIEDFDLKPRLNNNRGTAILVAASLYDACHYFRLFQKIMKQTGEQHPRAGCGKSARPVR